jgi:alginate O-acetyltransferase complex protein AlgI
MFLAGLWHGAAWTFVVWGLVHGALLGGHAALAKHGLTPRSTVVNRVLTFAAVVAAFVIFRAPNLSTAATILGAMAGLGGVESPAALLQLVSGTFLLLLAALLVFVNVAPNTWEIRLLPRARHGLAIGLAGGLAIMTLAGSHPFLYFQF